MNVAFGVASSDCEVEWGDVELVSHGLSCNGDLIGMELRAV